MTGALTVLAGTANPDLAANIAEELGIRLGGSTVQSFPDGELQVELLQSVRGHDVHVVQSTSPPVERRLLELVLLADACHRAGAARVTAIVPYFGYARQDRRVARRQALGARVVADMLGSSAIHRLVVVDLHTPAIEGFFPMAVEQLTAVPLLSDAIRPVVAGESSIVVAPDLGAVRLAEHYARLLELPLAIVHKTRVSGQEVSVRQIVGDVRDRLPIIVDDMLSTGATIEAAMNALLTAGCRTPATVAVSHGLFVGRAEEVLLPLPIRTIHTTDTVTQRPDRLPIEVHSLGPLIAEAMWHLHTDESLGDLYGRVRNRELAASSPQEKIVR
jgi:ribose-phosphate pyrophosphokinase